MVSHIYEIELQKRGLTHAHILIMFADKVKTIQQIDAMVSAEIPDSSSHPLAYKTFLESLIHGPYRPFFRNAPCMKHFLEQTFSKKLCRKNYTC